MKVPPQGRRLVPLAAAVLAVVAAVSLAAITATPMASAAVADVTTAWHNGRFVVGTAGVVRRSDVVLDRLNSAPQDSMPLGNGTLGAAEWAANGLTVQLNRADTLPARKSPGQVDVPGLAAIANAPDFHAYLDLYDGMFVESGGGMTARMYVRADKDELVIDVTGADPASAQTADLTLWSGRSPQAQAGGTIGTLAETWADARWRLGQDVWISGRDHRPRPGRDGGGNRPARRPGAVPASRRRVVPDRGRRTALGGR